MSSNARALILSIVSAFVMVRIYLWFNPAQMIVFGTRIHHIYSGIFLMVVGGIPSAITHEGKSRFASLCIFGVGVGMALDEWLFFVAQGGNDALYHSVQSLAGAVVLITVTCIYIAMIDAFTAKGH